MSTENAIALDVPISVAKQHVSCDLENEVVVLSLDDGVYYSLNPVATRIWELMQEPTTILAIRDRLLEEYEGVDPELCTREILTLLEQLREWDLIQIGDGA